MNTLNLRLSRSWHLFLAIITFCLIDNSHLLAQIPEPGIVATPDSHVTQIALNILDQGGNAIDAGTAALFALSVVQPYATGIGGGGFMLIWIAKEKKAIIIDFRERTPQSTDPAIFYQDNETFNIYTKYGYQSICVPGMVAGAEKALKSYGTMTFQQVLQPAIELATDGFVVTEALAKLTTEYYNLLESNRATSFIFLPDWFPLKKGQIQQREDLAFTFGLISLHGAKVFYQGEIANEIVNEMVRNNGLIQINDLETYEPGVRSAIRGSYQNFEVISVPSPGSGGTALIELLRISEKFNFNKYSLNSGPYIHLFAEAMKQVLDDRENYFMGDPKFDRLNPQLVVSDNYIQKCYNQIDSSSVRSVLNRMKSRISQDSGNGSHISILDSDGNAISISSTLNGFFGAAITIPKYGILLNNGMHNFSIDSSKNNSLKPGKRPQTTLAPTILLKNQKPYMILGGNGAERIISMLAQIIINVADFKLPLDEAIRSPRFHYNYYDDTIEMETRIEANAIDYLKKLGHKINLRNDYNVYFGSAQVILFDPENKIYSAVNDVREEGMVYIK
jgi:gamma-glutamyltranspeptidase/glutathione hydrolase